MWADNEAVAGESMSLMSTQRVTTTRGEFLDAIRNAFVDVASEGCREMWICDVDFADWPLSERPVIESLTRWAYAHRKLTVLSTTYEEFHRRHARFVEWRRQWSHVVECRLMEEIEPGDMPSLLLAPGVVTCSTARATAPASRSIRAIRSIAARSLMRFRNDRAKRFLRPRSVSREKYRGPYNRGLGIGNARAFLVCEVGTLRTHSRTEGSPDYR